MNWRRICEDRNLKKCWGVVGRMGGCVDSKLRMELEGRRTRMSGEESGERQWRSGCVQRSVCEEAWSLSLREVEAKGTINSGSK